MDYYDGNTVTGLWNYAQHFAMSDNTYGTTYGPSTPGALNVTSAQTYGAICGPDVRDHQRLRLRGAAGLNTTTSASLEHHRRGPPGADQPAGPGTTYSDADPTYDICSYLPSSDGGDGDTPAGTLTMGGNNIGEELTTSDITWGWFEGGFDNGYVPGHGTPPTTAQICARDAQEHRRRPAGGRLHPAPRAVRVLRLDRQPDAPAADVGGRGRAHRPGQPPVRHRPTSGPPPTPATCRRCRT